MYFLPLCIIIILSTQHSNPCVATCIDLDGEIVYWFVHVYQTHRCLHMHTEQANIMVIVTTHSYGYVVCFVSHALLCILSHWIWQQLRDTHTLLKCVLVNTRAPSPTHAYAINHSTCVATSICYALGTTKAYIHIWLTLCNSNVLLAQGGVELPIMSVITSLTSVDMCVSCRMLL